MGITMARDYDTMTTGGVYGNSYRAETLDEAAALAEKDGYTVLDLDDYAGRIIIGNQRTVPQKD
jgi:hypothetical protein